MQVFHGSYTDQICFCTVNSLRMLKKINHKPIIKIEDIGEQIVEKLVIDFNFDEETAVDKFFSSDTFTTLADTSTQLYKKSWQEIYEMLKIEFMSEVFVQQNREN